MFALLISLALVAGCGATSDGQAAGVPDPPSPPASARTVDRAEAEQAFGLLGELDEAWEKTDCAAVDHLTAWAENALGGRACQATRNGRPAPARESYSDPEYFLPDDGGWFVALARKPDPAYFLFLFEAGRWRLGAGPVPVVGTLPEHAGTASPEPAVARRARLVPQRHLTFLTDPAGVGGVTFPKGDPVRELLDELAARPAKARPDRVSTDVELLGGPSRVLALAGGSMLVFHAVRVVYHQKPGAGRSTLARPLYGGTDLKAFTGKAKPATLTVSELVVLASEIDPKNKVSTVALRHTLADLTE